MTNDNTTVQQNYVCCRCVHYTEKQIRPIKVWSGLIALFDMNAVTYLVTTQQYPPGVPVLGARLGSRASMSKLRCIGHSRLK